MVIFSHKYLMANVTPVTPFGVNIRTDYSPTHNYAIPLMQTDCWPVRLKPSWQQVVISAVQNNAWNQQQGSLLAWLSVNPNGINVIPPQIRGGTVHLQLMGVTWCFYDETLDQSLVRKAALQMPINVNALGDGDIPAYWFNVQNLDGKENAYYLQFHYYGLGAEFIQ